jgi:hypothetical protein
MLAPFEARPQGHMHVYASAPWFSAPSGVLQSLDLQTQVQPEQALVEEAPIEEAPIEEAPMEDAPIEALVEVQPEAPIVDDLVQQWIGKRPLFITNVDDLAAIFSWFNARPENVDLASVSF